jgi:hypothetical protein
LFDEIKESPLEFFRTGHPRAILTHQLRQLSRPLILLNAFDQFDEVISRQLAE